MRHHELGVGDLLRSLLLKTGNIQTELMALRQDVARLQYSVDELKEQIATSGSGESQGSRPSRSDKD